MGQVLRFRTKALPAQVRFLAGRLLGCVILGTAPALSGPQFPDCFHGSGGECHGSVSLCREGAHLGGKTG